MVDLIPINRRKMNTNQPPNADVILDRFTREKPTTPEQQLIPDYSTKEPHWLKAKSLLRSAVQDNDSAAAEALEQYIHHLSVKNVLLQYELDGAQEALCEKEKMKDKQRVLPLMAHDLEWHGGAKWWSPSSKREADSRWNAQQRYEEELEAAKAIKRELQHA